MTYDRWKARNLEDELDVGEPPQVWEECEACQGEGSIAKPRPFHDDPDFCVMFTCEECGGAGGRLCDARGDR